MNQEKFRYKKRHIIFILCFWMSISRANDLEKTGDYLQVLLPSTALLSSYLTEEEGTPENLKTRQFIKSFSYGFLTIQGLKVVVEKRRPHLGNQSSFPSGHTFAAFNAASFIHKRFGYYYGIPSYLLASVVGYSRIESKSHFVDDVFAGATIGILFNQFFTSEKEVFLVSPVPSGVVAQIDLPLESMEKEKNESSSNFSFLFGPTYIKSLFVSEGSSMIALSDLPKEESYNYTASFQFNYLFLRKNKILITLNPYEHIGVGNFPTDITFQDQVFLASENHRFHWLQYSLDLDYYYKLYSKDFINFYGGVALNSNYSRFEVESLQGLRSYSTDRLGVIGNLTSQVEFVFNSKLSSSLSFNWYQDSETKLNKLKFDVNYRLNRVWSVLSRISHVEQRIELGEFQKNNSERTIVSDSKYQTIYVGINYSFY